VLLLVRCFGPQRYRFSQSVDQIVSIDIVEGMTEKDACSGNFSNAVVLASIPEEVWDQVVTEIKEVKCRSYIGDPIEWIGGKVFRITYQDGGTELIGIFTSFYYRWNEDGKGKFSYPYFDKEQFSYLIEKYLNEYGVGE